MPNVHTCGYSNLFLPFHPGAGKHSTICAGSPVAAHTPLPRVKGTSSGGSWGGGRFKGASCKTNEEYASRQTTSCGSAPRRVDAIPQVISTFSPICPTWRQAVDFHSCTGLHGTSSLKETDPEGIEDTMVHTREEERAASIHQFSAQSIKCQVNPLDATGFTCLLEILSLNRGIPLWFAGFRSPALGESRLLGSYGIPENSVNIWASPGSCHFQAS